MHLEHVRVFGCKAYQWLDPDQRYNQQPDVSRHLHNRSRSLIYVGHSMRSSSWLLYDLNRNKIVYSGKPQFIEEFDKSSRRISSPITDSILDGTRVILYRNRGFLYRSGEFPFVCDK